ncbi:MAG: protein kinase, partial [Holophaga sp.]|nr:protein kinase [Holophaga sp.]
IRQRLGEGTFGIVFEAMDSERKLPVALKLLHEPRAEALYLFKQEFRALVDLVHPNLVSPFELLSFGPQWFFTMELVAGRTFLAYLRGETGAPENNLDQTLSSSQRDFRAAASSDSPSRDRPSTAEEVEAFPISPSLYSAPPSYEPFADLLIQMAQGLGALHGAGLLHRDIKPGNVLVTSDGRVKILDFGLATLAAPGVGDSTSGEAVVGTIAYMAPELAKDEPGTAACDWYAVGVMLYQGLTGQLPYTGTPLEMAKFRREFDPCPPSLLVPGIPVELEQLCMDLLQRDPSLRPTGAEVLRRLGQVAPNRNPGHEEILNAVSAPSTGRAQEMRLLLQAFERVKQGAPRIVSLRGASGLGKSFIVRRFLREIHRMEPQALLLAGRCYEQESVPFKALDNLIDALGQHLRQLPEAELEALLPPRAKALARMFPVLQQLPALAGPEEEVEPLEFRRRALTALRELLSRLAAKQPVVLTIDDLQWGDLDSAALLIDLMALPDAPPLLLLLCSTKEGSESSTFLAALEAAPHFAQQTLGVELKELPESEALSLALALLGPDYVDSATAARQIAAECGGNPFYIGEMARQMRAGTLAPGGDLDSYLTSRISDLPESAQRILRVLAVAACPLAHEPLRNAAEVHDEAPQSITLLRAAHLARPLSGPRRRTLEIYHTRIRALLIHAMAPAERRAINLALAFALEASADADPETLAIHFEGGGELGKASEFTALAAEKAFTALAFDHAAMLFRHSLKLRPADDPAVSRLLTALGDALTNAGRSAEAAESYMLAIERVPRKEVSRLRRRAAEEYLRAGQMELGTAVLQDVLTSAGETYPSSKFWAVVSILFYRFRLKLRGLSFRERPAAEVSPKALEKIDVLWAAAMGLGPIDILRGTDFQGRQLFKTLEAGEPFRVVRALAHETIFVAQHGSKNLAATQRIVSSTLALAERLGHPKSLARAYIASGIASTLQGRWRAAANFLLQAEALLRDHCTGVAYELHITQHHRLLVLTYMGRLGEVAHSLPVLLKEARERGDLLAITDLRLSVEAPQKLAEDRPDLARIEVDEATAAWTTMGFHTQHYHAMVSRVNLELYLGNLPEAARILEQTWPALASSMLLRVQTIAITAWELQARVHLGQAFDPCKRTHHIAEAHRAMARIQREDTDYGDALMLKLNALESLVVGQPIEAKAQLLEAEIKFEACDMTAHAVTMRLARAILSGTEGEASRHSAEAWFESQGVKKPKRYTVMQLPTSLLRN